MSFVPFLSEVGAVCGSSARTDLRGGVPGDRYPYRDSNPAFRYGRSLSHLRILAAIHPPGGTQKILGCLGG